MIKNFLFVLKRFKTSSVINIVGLTTAFASFFIIAMHVYFEYSFERCHPNADRIYRVEIATGDDGNAFILPRPLIRAVIQSSPHILAGTLINPYIDRFYFTVENGGQAQGFRETFVTCNTDITQIFNFRMIEGRADCLKQSENVIIPQSMARRIFGKESAVGKQIALSGHMWTKQNRGFLVVGGVYEDFPANTQLNNYIYTAIAVDDYTVDDWTSFNYLGYLLLDENATPEEAIESFNKTFDFSLCGGDGEHLSIRLTPLRSIYFTNVDALGQIVKSGNPATPLILLTIGVLIIAIAIINYTNFAMALAPRRMRSINTHKIFGSTTAALKINIIAESVIMSLLSFLLAVALAYLIYSSRFALFGRIDIHPLHNLPSLATTGIIALATGLIAGIRPAFYMTSVPPAMAVNGNYGLSPSGKKLRTTLIGFQFFVSIVLIFCAFFLYKQNKFMQKYSLGYDTEQIALVELPQSIAGNSRNVFVAALKDHPDIADAAFSHQKFGASDGYRRWGGKYKEEMVGFYSLPVSWNFPAVMGIKAIDGRLPNESDEGKGYCISYLINKTLQKKYGITPGELIDVPWMKKSDNPDFGRVLGVVDDLKFASLRQEAGSMAFVINENWNLQPWSYIRINAGADVREVVEHIQKTIANLDAAFPASVEFYDEVFDTLYRKELNAEAIIGLFSLIAVIIAVAGVFGLVMFECEYKRKEISIRKVMGSTGYEILLLFNKSYLLIFAVGFALAIPAGYYIAGRWLDNFAYKTALSWWVFALAGLPVLVVIILTVCAQCYKAAVQNPTKALNRQ